MCFDESFGLVDALGLRKWHSPGRGLLQFAHSEWMSWSWSWFRGSFNVSSGFCEFAKCDSLDEFAYELAFPSAVMNVSEIFLVTRNVLKLGVDGIGFLTHR